MGCYLDPDNASTIEVVIAAIIQQTDEAELLVAGNFNVDLADQEGNTRDEEIYVSLSTIGV